MTEQPRLILPQPTAAPGLNDGLGQVLGAVFFLAGQDDATRQDFAAMVRVRSFPKGNVLFHEGDPCPTAYLVIDGQVKLTLFSEEGREFTLHVYGPGEIAGFIPTLDGGPHFGSGVTLTPARLGALPQEQLTRWLQAHPALQQVIVRELSVTIRQAYAAIARQALLPVKERVRRALLEIAARDGRPLNPKILIASRPTHQEIADRVGSTRVVVTRAIKELLEEDDAIFLNGRELRVRLSAVEVRQP